MMNKKIAMFTIAMVLLLGITMGVTFALMTDTTDTITNTFVAGNFGKLQLDEAYESGDEAVFYKVGDDVSGIDAPQVLKDSDDKFTGLGFTVTPGATFTKQVRVSFESTSDTASASAYVYVAIEEDIFDNVTNTGWKVEQNGDGFATEFKYYNNNKEVLLAPVVKVEDEYVWKVATVEGFAGLLLYKESTNNADNDADIDADRTLVISSVTVPDTLTESDISGIDCSFDFTAYACQTADVGDATAAFATAFPGKISQ